MHKKKGESKKFYQHHIGVRDNFAGLVGVVVATPDLHDQPPVEKKKRKSYCQNEGRNWITGK